MTTHQPESSSKIYTVFTIGQPGLGKSYLIKKVQDMFGRDERIRLVVCTSDEARSRVLAKVYKEQNIDVSKLSQEEIY